MSLELALHFLFSTKTRTETTFITACSSVSKVQCSESLIFFSNQYLFPVIAFVKCVSASKLALYQLIASRKYVENQIVSPGLGFLQVQSPTEL